MPSDVCLLCTTRPGTLTMHQHTTRCVCGFELRYHAFGCPHGFTGRTPACPGFQAQRRREAAAPAEAVQLPLVLEALP